jgi:geranylgeranyl diphosphate synthase type II
MRYSVLAQGKRIRPLLTLAVAAYFGVRPAAAMHVACSIEMIHCASLILDDLPCMDNDHERRKRLATHVKFGESLTILAAVSLLTQSCCTIASHQSLEPDLRLKLVQMLCDTVGPHGLSLGQYIDLHGVAGLQTPSAITNIHHLKTGVLFLAAARAGCLIARASAAQEEKVMRFTNNIGLAFQLLDDLKDMDSPGTNMVAHIGVSNAERRLRDYLDAANDAVEGERNAETLQGFARAFFGTASR